MIKEWILAARPKTLPTSIAAVLLAAAFAWLNSTLNIYVSTICILFALTAQIAANFANDYYDYIKGGDNETRVGPRRAVASGAIKPKTMLMATVVAVVISVILGSLLIPIGGWSLVILGIIIVIFAMWYSAGRYALSRIGLGEVTVFIFFGLIPVCATYWLQGGDIPTNTIIGGCAMGLLSANILLVNNYRDVKNDAASGKRTIIVILGRRFAIITYLLNGFAASAIMFYQSQSTTSALLFLAIHISTWVGLTKHNGAELNRFIGRTALNQLLYVIIFIITIYFLKA